MVVHVSNGTGQSNGSEGRYHGQSDAGGGIEQVDVELAMRKGNLIALEDMADFRSDNCRNCDGDQGCRRPFTQDYFL